MICDVDIMNVILLMNITSIAIVTFPCFFCISGGTLNLLTGTCSVVCIFFPFSDPRLGPKMSSDLRMSTHSWETACVLRNQFTRIPLMF